MAEEILVLTDASAGHVYPTLALVTELVDRGHRVSYVVSPEFVTPVRAAGAEVVHFESAIAQVDPAEVFGRDDRGARAHMLFVDENVAILAAAAARFRENPPDLVVYADFSLIAGQLLAQGWGRPAVRLSAAFASNDEFSMSRAMIEASGTVDPLRLDAFRWRLSELLASYGVRGSIEEFWNRIEETNVVFIPKEFQVAQETFDDRFCFVGPCLGNRSFLGEWRPPESGHPVVLVSLGTTFNDHPNFFRDCARAFAGLPWHVVMTVGDRVSVEELGELPENVEAHQSIAHFSVLEHASVCVTHGGMGTLMESFYWACPVVTVPHSFDVRQMARQVEALGLGTVVSPESLTAQRLRAAVLATAEDETIAGHVREMSRRVRDSGGAARAADKLQKLMLDL